MLEKRKFLKCLGLFCYSKYDLTIIDQGERLTSILSERKEEHSQAIKNCLRHLTENEFNMHSKVTVMLKPQEYLKLHQHALSWSLF